MAFLPGLRPFVTTATLTIVASPLLVDPASFMAPVAGTVTAAPAEIAGDNVLALIREMFGLHATTGQICQRNLPAQHPVILGLFSGAGSRFILCRPGRTPLEVPEVSRDSHQFPPAISGGTGPTSLAELH